VAQNQTAIVVGGGVIGCSAAYFLLQHGWHVQLLDVGQIGRACSHGNCGFICPSHVLPLTTPGAVLPALRNIFSRDSAIYIKPRWDPALWVWLAKFSMKCRGDHVMHAAAARHALLTSSMHLYRELLAAECIDVEWEDRGLLFVYKSPQQFDAFGKTAELVEREFGIVAARYDAPQVVQFEPALRTDVAGGWHYPGDAHLRPDRLLTTLQSLLEQRGVEILPNTRVNDINIYGSVAKSVDTAGGTMLADAVVLAAGAETPRFSRRLSCRIPIQPGKGYSITMPRPQNGPKTPLILEEYHVAVTPWQSGLRIGSTMEFVGYDRSINRRRIELFHRAAAEYLAEPAVGPVEEEWYGWRPMTVDELPCIGRAPRVPNVVVAAGHGMIGMATALATGKLVAEIVAGATPHIDPAPYSLRRFTS
jgi:D-amino-acid dehydrogenase